MELKKFEEVIEKVFEDSKVRILDIVYELSDNKKFYKLVYSIHSLNISKTEEFEEILLHTKLIFKVNLSKTKLIDNYFYYLKDINCIYSKVEFQGIEDFNEKLNKLFKEKNFGEDILNLSELLSNAPTTRLNYNLNKLGVDNVFIYSFLYEPKYKTRPCGEVTFDFSINLKSSEINLSIKKIDQEYFFYYKYLNNSLTEIEQDLEELPYKISNHISKTLN